VNRDEHTHMLASMTEQEIALRQLRDQIFGEPDAEPDAAPDDGPQPRNVVPREGRNPGPIAPAGPDALNRQFLQDLLGSPASFYEQRL